MNTLDLAALLERSESQTLDFKSKQYPFAGARDEVKGELLKDILSLANAAKDSDAYIVIGVEEKHERAKHLCGADTTLRDSDVQQFVNAKTNRPISFLVEVLLHEGVNLTIITIHKVQKRPIFLTKDFGFLKGNVVYIRRGSSTAEATLDEIAGMGRAESAALAHEEKKRARKEQEDRFWREFKSLLHQLYHRILSQRANTAHHVFDNIIEYRLPLPEATSVCKEAHELDLDDELRRKLDQMLKLIRIIEEYIDGCVAEFVGNPSEKWRPVGRRVDEFFALAVACRGIRKSKHPVREFARTGGMQSLQSTDGPVLGLHSCRALSPEPQDKIARCG